eukprot:COSAG05_NODE_912_length_6631_cov_192.387171_3_plen_218_part_00
MACDACIATITHAQIALERAEFQQRFTQSGGHRRVPPGRPLAGWRVLSILEEDICQFSLPAVKGGKMLDVSPGAFWHSYGVKLVDSGPTAGDKVLDGPALPHNTKLSGVSATGASTLPGRLSRRCSEITSEIGELELYEKLRAAPDWGALAGGVDETITAVAASARQLCSDDVKWCAETAGGRSAKGKGKSKGKANGKGKKRNKNAKRPKKTADCNT